MRNPVFLPVLVLLLCACSTLAEKQRSSDLDSALFHYNEAIRWSDFAAAARYHTPDRIIPAPATGANPVRVTACDIVQVDLAKDERSAEVSMNIAYYRENGMTVQTITDRQHWQYDPGKKVWIITTPLPDFR